MTTTQFLCSKRLLHNKFSKRNYPGTTAIKVNQDTIHTATILCTINTTTTGRNLVSYRCQQKRSTKSSSSNQSLQASSISSWLCSAEFLTKQIWASLQSITTQLLYLVKTLELCFFPEIDKFLGKKFNLNFSSK